MTTSTKPRKPKMLRSLSPERRILPPATKPTHFTMAEIRRLLDKIDKEKRDAGAN